MRESLGFFAEVAEFAREVWQTIAIRVRRAPPHLWIAWFAAAVLAVVSLSAFDRLGSGNATDFDGPTLGLPGEDTTSSAAHDPDDTSATSDTSAAPQPALPVAPAAVGEPVYSDRGDTDPDPDAGPDAPAAPETASPTDPPSAGGRPATTAPPSDPPSATTTTQPSSEEDDAGGLLDVILDLLGG